MNRKKPLVERRILPICARCKRIRNESGQWESIESYMLARFGVEFSHTLCPTHLDQEIADSSHSSDVMCHHIAETRAGDDTSDAERNDKP